MTKQRPWTAEEVGLLITTVETYKGNQHWTIGQRKLAWGAVASELNRTVKSVQSKWSALVRKGIVKDDRA